MLTLTVPELRALTGYAQPARQLAELRHQGFYRARLSPVTGAVIWRSGMDAKAAGGMEQAQRLLGHSDPRQTADYVDGNEPDEVSPAG